MFCLSLPSQDTLGVEKLRCPAQCNGKDGIFLAFSVDDPQSFEDVPFWLRQIQLYEGLV